MDVSISISDTDTVPVSVCVSVSVTCHNCIKTAAQTLMAGTFFCIYIGFPQLILILYSALWKFIMVFMVLIFGCVIWIFTFLRSHFSHKKLYKILTNFFRRLLADKTSVVNTAIVVGLGI